MLLVCSGKVFMAALEGYEGPFWRIWNWKCRTPRSPCLQVIGYSKIFTVTARKRALCDVQNALVHLANFQSILFSSSPKPGAKKRISPSPVFFLLQL